MTATVDGCTYRWTTPKARDQCWGLRFFIDGGCDPSEVTCTAEVATLSAIADVPVDQPSVPIVDLATGGQTSAISRKVCQRPPSTKQTFDETKEALVNILEADTNLPKISQPLILADEPLLGEHVEVCSESVRLPSSQDHVDEIDSVSVEDTAIPPITETPQTLLLPYQAVKFAEDEPFEALSPTGLVRDPNQPEDLGDKLQDGASDVLTQCIRLAPTQQELVEDIDTSLPDAEPLYTESSDLVPTLQVTEYNQCTRSGLINNSAHHGIIVTESQIHHLLEGKEHALLSQMGFNVEVLKGTAEPLGDPPPSRRMNDADYSTQVRVVVLRLCEKSWDRDLKLLRPCSLVRPPEQRRITGSRNARRCSSMRRPQLAGHALNALPRASRLNGISLTINLGLLALMTYIVTTFHPNAMIDIVATFYHNNLAVNYQHFHRYTGITTCIMHHSNVPVVFGEFHQLDDEFFDEILPNRFEEEERGAMFNWTHIVQTIWPQEDESASSPNELLLTGPTVPGLVKDMVLSPQRSKPNKTISYPVFPTPSTELAIQPLHPVTGWDFAMLRWRLTLQCVRCLWNTAQYSDIFFPRIPDPLHWIRNLWKL